MYREVKNKNFVIADICGSDFSVDIICNGDTTGSSESVFLTELIFAQIPHKFYLLFYLKLKNITMRVNNLKIVAKLVQKKAI